MAEKEKSEMENYKQFSKMKQKATEEENIEAWNRRAE